MESLEENKKQSILLLNFFEKLREEIASQAQILALRPKLAPTIESNFIGDFDFIILEDHFITIFNTIYTSCKNSGINFVLNQKTPNKKIIRFFIQDIERLCLTVEFWTAIDFTYNNHKNSFPVKAIFDSLNSKRITEPEVLSLIYLTHIFHKDKNIFSDENNYRFKIFSTALLKEKVLLEDGKVFKLLNEVQQGILKTNESNTEALRLLSSVGIKHVNPILAKLKVLSRKAWNKIFSLKLLIPIVGPDGVGKGIVSEKSLSGSNNTTSFSFKSLYRVRKLYKLRLLFIANAKGRPKNLLDEKIGYYTFFMASLGIRVLQIKNFGKTILLDRYFTDYFGAPIRYLRSNQHPKKLSLYKFLLFLTPLPNKMVFMGCKDTSLIARKNELPIISVDFLQSLYCEFIVEKQVPQILFISTENQIDVSVAALRDFLKKTDRKKHIRKSINR